jgi:AraC-type transcriptional regulator N-terminus
MVKEKFMRKQVMNQNYDNNGMEDALEALGRGIARWTDKNGINETAISALKLSRLDTPGQPSSYIYEPSICLIAQGVKQVLFGDETYVLDVHHFLIRSVDLPTVVRIIKARPEKPYLGLTLNINRRVISQLMADSNLPPPRPHQSNRGMATGEVTLPLITAFQRLINCLMNRKIFRFLRLSFSVKLLTICLLAIRERVCDI